MARTLYVDASALLKLVVAEPESWALSDALRNEHLVTSDLSRVELRRAILRLHVEPGALRLAARVTDPLEVLRMDDAVLDLAGEVGPGRLRALDAIHLASALTFGRELDAIVTYDRRLADAAENVGLHVEAPGRG